jgi:Spy/CpxP family protein refolding chaperone
MKLNTFLSLAPLASLLVFAQGPGLGPGRGPGGGPGQQPFTDVKAYLNLTDTQIQQIQAARQGSLDSVKTLQTQVQAKDQALRDLLDKGSTDAAAVGKLMLDINALHKQVKTLMDGVQQRAVSFLSADQKAKLKALEDAAKMQPAIGQAAGLGLLQPPQGGPGIGFGGPRGMPGGMSGRMPGRMMQRDPGAGPRSSTAKLPRALA